MTRIERMVFQILTNDKHIFTVHTEVGEGLTRVVIEDNKPDELEDSIEPDESG